MGYYDGNTATALWNYAQHFAMSGNFFGSNFGTTVMGHLNLISGQTMVPLPPPFPVRW
jgi:phospholipase C